MNDREINLILALCEAGSILEDVKHGRPADEVVADAKAAIVFCLDQYDVEVNEIGRSLGMKN